MLRTTKKEDSMKKELFFVLVGLSMISFSVFGLGSSDSRGQLSGSNRRSVSEGADLAEVPETDYTPRQNPLVQRAGVVRAEDLKAKGDVYALPATALKPEVERLPPPVYAISGVKGQEINENHPWWEVVDIVVDLPGGEKFSRGLIEGHDISDWILNLPKGLEAKAHRIKKGAVTAKIYISGTPEETMRDTIRVTIPGDFLESGLNREFASPTESDSRQAWEEIQTQSEI
jgi:hypothetical protein